MVPEGDHMVNPQSARKAEAVGKLPSSMPTLAVPSLIPSSETTSLVLIPSRLLVCASPRGKPDAFY